MSCELRGFQKFQQEAEILNALGITRIHPVGSLVKDFKGKCEVLDERKQNERRGKTSDAGMLVNAASDIKKQIEEEFEKIAQQQAVHLSKLQPRQNQG